MPHEIEAKLEVRNPRTLKRRLVELGFQVIRARSLESNRLYDFVDGRLRKAGGCCDCALCWVAAF
jgi:Holliday junction resolvase